MLKRQRKINFVGSASCISLLLLAFLLVNPLVGDRASALEDFAEENEAVVETGEAVTQSDDGIAAKANTSDISISFSPTSGSASLTPTNSAGQSAQINVLATVGVKNSGGYSVYVKGSSQNLVGQKSSSNVIPGVSGSSTYANLPVNTWGYYAGTGTAVPENAVYKAVTTSGNGDKVAENTNTRINSDTKTIALSFAAKVNDQKPADTYKNTITLSVVSSPKQVTFTDFTTTMQGMTSSICSQVSDGTEAQLRDTRDGKYYWIGKLADGKCWMTQNLNLDLSTSKTLTSADSDVSSNWTPTYSTATQVTSDTVNFDSQTETRSWSLGNYRIINPTTSSDCGYPKNDLSQCTAQFTVYDTPTTQNKDASAHYIVGNYYQWNAATAGTGSSITSGQATSSICPKGWKLPESNSTAVGSFGGLLSKYSIVDSETASMNKLTSPPLYFVRGGFVSQNTSSLFRGAGNFGNYWSSIPVPSTDLAYGLHFGNTNGIIPSDTNVRQYGFSAAASPGKTLQSL